MVKKGNLARVKCSAVQKKDLLWHRVKGMSPVTPIFMGFLSLILMGFVCLQGNLGMCSIVDGSWVTMGFDAKGNINR